MGRPPLKLVGRRFGRLTVKAMAEIKRGNRYWRCACDCGREVVVVGTSLTAGRTMSCGCLVRDRALDMTGWSQGLLRVIREAGRDDHRAVLWLVHCGGCGRDVVLPGIRLRWRKPQACPDCVKGRLAELEQRVRALEARA